MATLTFQVVDGADKGAVFADVATPLTIGRESGNGIRLNDERVSRCHLKVQEDHGQIVLTDLDSTNGTRVNGQDVQLRVLRIGDLIHVGRSALLFGSSEEIGDLARVKGGGFSSGAAGEMPPPKNLGQTYSGDEPTMRVDNHLESELLPSQPGSNEPSEEDDDDPRPVWTNNPPPLPSGLSPGQAAQLAELFDYVHRCLADLSDSVSARPKATQVQLDQEKWQNLLSLQMQLAQYLRRVADPDES